MKRITFSLLLFLAMVSGTYAQVQIGEGTNQVQNVPFEPYYGYSYTQSIYHASEINAAGSITSIQWYFSGSSTLSNNQQLVIYMGHTDKAAFENQTDFVSVDEMTQVYTGGITVTGPGWVTLTLTTPFEYNGEGNLVIAVDENQVNYNNSDDDFYNTAVTDSRSIYVYSDTVNTDPTDPANATGSPARGMASFVPNIILGGITQACANVTGLSAAGVGTQTANLSWQAAGTQSAWQVLVLEAGSEAPGPGDAGQPATGTPTYQATELNDSSDYVFYVRADCGSGLFSGWSSGYSFTTQCPAFAEFEENFDSSDVVVGSYPECWSRIQNTSDQYAYARVEDYGSSSPSKNFGLYNSGDATAQLYLITPTLSDLPANTHRMKFKAVGGTGYELLVGTMSDPNNPSTFTLVQTIALTGSYSDYFVTFNTSTTNGFVAFKHGLGGTYRTIRIDNVVWEVIPSVAPDCVSDVAVATNESCGNFATALTWSTVEGADGYRISIGTTPAGTDAVNNVDLGNNASYSFSGAHNTEYYYTVTAYNAAGSATGCAEDVFTTYSEGCYCTSLPTSNDNSGITNVKLGASEFAVTDVMYYDFSGDAAVDLIQGITNNTLITFGTGYTYDTNIWIDFNDNFNFESNEKVYSGVSLADNPTTLNASFLMPETAALGTHRMRIGTADSGQFTPNPCYSGSYGITLDFTVNILPIPACLPPSAGTVSPITANTAVLNWVSTDTLFNVEYAAAGTALGEGTLVSGLTGNSYPLSSLDPQTDYQFYVQTDCGVGGVSPWAGPFVFRTACDPFGDFEENFTTEVTVSAPECWYKIVNSTSQYAEIRTYNYNDYVQLSNSDDASATLLLITPSLTDLVAGTHRVKFKATTYSTNSTLIVGTMTDPAVASTFTPVSTINLPSNGTFAEFTVPFTAATGNYVAFKHGGGGTYRTIYMDDVIWEPIPTVLPNCVEDFNITLDEECGNFASLFEWTAVENADGYKVTIGTTSGGNDVIDNQDIGNIVAATFTGVYNTTYYYTITPYNLLGNAVGCVEGTFTTAATGCYCASIPTSNDDLGITNVIIGDSEFSIEDVMYADKTEEATVALAKDAETNLIVTFATGYTYNTNIWIDFNNNYTFEASEIVYSGESTNANPTDLDASFTLPASATLGLHRMRIGTADSGQATPNACYSGSYGITLDFTVEVFDSLGTAQFDNGSFKVYPNPVSNILNLSYTQNITNVAVFNILGQQVITNNVNATQGQVDMSNLAVGTYLVKVTAGDETKTIKVVKK